MKSQGKGARRKGRFKGSDGSTSSDTTTNSLVRQSCGSCRRLKHISSFPRGSMEEAGKGGGLGQTRPLSRGSCKQLNQCASLQLYVSATAQQHCRGFGSPEDQAEWLQIFELGQEWVGWWGNASPLLPLLTRPSRVSCVLVLTSVSSGGPHLCGPSAQAWTEAEWMLLPDRESVRRPSAPPRPGPLHAVLWAGPSSESTASI
ncbi:hypothetical protein INR49_014917, partial [Caranx melampygus]